MDGNSRKVEYFLKNYFLNYSVGKQGIRIHDIKETTYYTWTISTDEKNITLNIARTRPLEQPIRYSVIGLQGNPTFSLVCYYELGHVEANNIVFTSPDSRQVVSYNAVDDKNIELYTAVNIIDEIFDHLSLAGEYERESHGKKVQPYYFQDKDSLLNEPSVDEYYSFFSEILNTLFERYSLQHRIRRKLEAFNVCLTHDVDTIAKNSLTQFRYLAFQFLNFMRNCDFSALKKIWRYVSHHSDFNQIVPIIHLEKSKECASTFFLASKMGKDRFVENMVSVLIDPRYNIRDRSLFKEIFSDIQQQGFEIGLHSSFLTARKGELLQKERDRLKYAANADIITNRSHFLNFSLGYTPLFLETVGIRCDASVYYNNICGFLRHKTCSPFYLYSHIENRIVDVVEIPTVIMDSTLFNYKRYSEEQAYKESVAILEKVKEQNGIVCINWHNETFTPEYGWYSIYPDLLDWIRENGGYTYTISEVYNRLTSKDDGSTIFISH